MTTTLGAAASNQNVRFFVESSGFCSKLLDPVDGKTHLLNFQFVPLLFASDDKNSLAHGFASVFAIPSKLY